MGNINDALFFTDNIDNPLDIIPDYDNYYDIPEGGYYNFYTNRVPRVSNILKECIYDQHLIDWFKNSTPERLNAISNIALKVGSIVHTGIEKYLLYGKDIGDLFIEEKTKSILSPKMVDNILTSYNNFDIWYKDLTKDGIIIEPIAIERSTVNPWYGGTIDCIMRITVDGKSTVLVLDFKTSKKISINYYLQTYAYAYSLKWEKNNNTGNTDIPDIDGIAILRLDKIKKGDIEFNTIDFKRDIDITNDINKSLILMVQWFYSSHRLKEELV